MSGNKKIVANLIDEEESRIAVLDANGRLCDYFTEYEPDKQQTGEIYKAKVYNVLEGMHCAFVNLGDGRSGFLYLKDAKDIKITVGTDILVQIVKNARKGKGARVSPAISLSGRFVALAPAKRMLGVSKQIEPGAERERLYTIIKAHRPDGFGIIARTAANGADETEIAEDISQLAALWDNIKIRAEQLPSPSCVYKQPKLIDRVLRDELTGEVSEIVVDTQKDCGEIKNYIAKFLPDSNIDSNYYSGKMPIFELYNIEHQLTELQDRRVWLKSGAYLVIDQTEALTAIDVNTGKYVGIKNLRDTVFKTNIEAAKEIARQLKLRAIGGIIIVDFIDMECAQDNEKLLSAMQEELATDRYKTKIHGITNLGLVELTRKRARTDYSAKVMRGCHACNGLGLIEKEQSAAMKIKRFIRKICLNSDCEALIIECSDEVAKFTASSFLSRWEEEFETEIILLGNKEFAQSSYKTYFSGQSKQLREKLDELCMEGRVNVYRTPSAERV